MRLLHFSIGVAPLLQLQVTSIDAASIFDWPDVLDREAWLFDHGSTHGFLSQSEEDGQRQVLVGPAPDWALADQTVPRFAFALTSNATDASILASSVTGYPGCIELRSGQQSALGLTVQLMFLAANSSLLRLGIRSAQPTGHIRARFHLSGSGTNISRSRSPGRAAALSFDLPQAPSDLPCFGASAGGLELGSGYLGDATTDSLPLPWSLEVDTDGKSFKAFSEEVIVPPGGEVATFVSLSFGAAGLQEAQAQCPARADEAFRASVARWDSMLARVLSQLGEPPSGLGTGDLEWVAVKALQTLSYNWRSVPGLPDGVLPSYTGYEGGFWSWDTYKQAVGMAGFAPELAKQQLRLLVSAQDPNTGHIPDKVDRCGRGGGCNGKPPLLSWAVWEVYAASGDLSFLAEMYEAVASFHAFWYRHRDVRGVGLCSWTEGMESGMDDGVRFMPQYASSETNESTRVSTLNFWSVDLNAYLYREKRVLAKMAAALSKEGTAKSWDAAAESLLHQAERVFFVPGPGAGQGFFQDRYFNGTPVPVRGCEAYAALFAQLASTAQVAATAKVLGDPTEFLLGFSLPTVSKADDNYNARGYWRGSTWLDQTWFAYEGLKLYGQSIPGLAHLAEELRRRVFAVGRGFRANDSTPFNEHYHPETGEPLGATHFSWSAVHALLWAQEARAPESAVRAPVAPSGFSV